jgi:hypothetical protein
MKGFWKSAACHWCHGVDACVRRVCRDEDFKLTQISQFSCHAKVNQQLELQAGELPVSSYDVLRWSELDGMRLWSRGSVFLPHLDGLVRFACHQACARLVKGHGKDASL